MTFDIESCDFISSFIWRVYVLDSGQAYYRDREIGKDAIFVCVNRFSYIRYLPSQTCLRFILDTPLHTYTVNLHFNSFFIRYFYELIRSNNLWSECANEWISVIRLRNYSSLDYNRVSVYYCWKSSFRNTRCCDVYFIILILLNEVTVAVVCVDIISYSLFVQDILPSYSIAETTM